MKFFWNMIVNNVELYDIIDSASKNDFVQGVILDLDSNWLDAWHYKNRYGEERLENIDAEMIKKEMSEEPTIDIQSKNISMNDLEWEPPFWAKYKKTIGLPQLKYPIIIKICLYPYDDKYEQMIPAFRSSNFQIIYEERPIAYLYTNPKKLHIPIIGGVSIGVTASDFATLGGILIDDNGKCFGSTCQHVFQNEIKRTGRHNIEASHTAAKDGNPKFIGEYTYGTEIYCKDPNDHCSPFSASHHNELDAALIEISQVKTDLSILGIGDIFGITPMPNIYPKQPIEFTGRSSGYSKRLVGGLAVIYEFSHFNEKFCYKNLFEIRFPIHNPIRLNPPVKPGDSGAWVCNYSKSGKSWCGVVIGGDTVQGYATFSETMKDWWEMEEGLNLKVNNNP
jgi:hypothetical protein